jgi:NADH-quinone oxidoreductase subunit K
MISTLGQYLTIAAILFVLGAIGFLTRRNLIIMFLSAEMMLQGVALNFVAFGYYHHNTGGQAFTIFLLTVAACEAAVALALILMLYRGRRTLDVSVWQDLREAGMEPIVDEESPEPPPPPKEFPQLTPAGRLPTANNDLAIERGLVSPMRPTAPVAPESAARKSPSEEGAHANP